MSNDPAIAAYDTWLALDDAVEKAGSHATNEMKTAVRDAYDTLYQTPAQSIGGIEAKLRCEIAIRFDDSDPDNMAFMALVGIARDLVNVTGETKEGPRRRVKPRLLTRIQNAVRRVVPLNGSPVRRTQ